MGALMPQDIIKILAGAGQYLFPVLLLGEAAIVALASRQGRRHPPAGQSNLEVTTPSARPEEGSADLEEVEPLAEPAHHVWSVALLNGLDAASFAALAALYYREKGILCAFTPSSGQRGAFLRMFQNDTGRVTAIVQFRAQGAPWVGPSQIHALQDLMAGEGIGKGIFMTPGAFSKDARESARASGITLIDGKMLLLMIGRLSPAARDRLLRVAMQAD